MTTSDFSTATGKGRPDKKENKAKIKSETVK